MGIAYLVQVLWQILSTSNLVNERRGIKPVAGLLEKFQFEGKSISRIVQLWAKMLSLFRNWSRRGTGRLAPAPAQ